MKFKTDFDEKTLNRKVSHIRIILEREDSDTFDMKDFEVWEHPYKTDLKSILIALHFLDQKRLVNSMGKLGGRKNKVQNYIQDFLTFGINEYRITQFLEDKTNKKISERTYYRILRGLEAKGIEIRKLMQVLDLWKAFRMLYWVIDRFTFDSEMDKRHQEFYNIA